MTKQEADQYTILHKELSGVHTVNRVGVGNQGGYTVNLDKNICTCKYGGPLKWVPSRREWYTNRYCRHKILVMADICTKSNEDLTAPYLKALITDRYNVFEVVSAFHKELRRGSAKHAWYWGTILTTFRGIRGVLRYLMDISYEEHRDHKFAKWIFDVYFDTKKHTPLVLLQAIHWFCQTKKKWEIHDRLEIFTDEMEAYHLLCEKFTIAVAKGAEIIPVKYYDKLFSALRKGIKTNDRVLFQYGLKGLQKCKHNRKNVEAHRIDIMKAMVATAKPKNKKIIAYIKFLEKRAGVYKIGYHELNALGDMLLGEPPKGNCLSKRRIDEIFDRDKVPMFPFGKILTIPKYAQDNHTRLGKQMIGRFPEQLEAGAVQSNIDLRWCGAYPGVAWRQLAHYQFNSCDIQWGDVKWPNGLHKKVMRLFY